MKGDSKGTEGRKERRREKGRAQERVCRIRPSNMLNVTGNGENSDSADLGADAGPAYSGKGVMGTERKILGQLQQ